MTEQEVWDKLIKFIENEPDWDYEKWKKGEAKYNIEHSIFLKDKNYKYRIELHNKIFRELREKIKKGEDIKSENLKRLEANKRLY